MGWRLRDDQRSRRTRLARRELVGIRSQRAVVAVGVFPRQSRPVARLSTRAAARAARAAARSTQSPHDVAAASVVGMSALASFRSWVGPQGLGFTWGNRQPSFGPLFVQWGYDKTLGGCL